jgi:hypothetical protein
MGGSRSGLGADETIMTPPFAAKVAGFNPKARQGAFHSSPRYSVVYELIRLSKGNNQLLKSICFFIQINLFFIRI